MLDRCLITKCLPKWSPWRPGACHLCDMGLARATQIAHGPFSRKTKSPDINVSKQVPRHPQCDQQINEENIIQTKTMEPKQNNPTRHTRPNRHQTEVLGVIPLSYGQCSIHRNIEPYSTSAGPPLGDEQGVRLQVSVSHSLDSSSWSTTDWLEFNGCSSSSTGSSTGSYWAADWWW